MIEPVTVNVRLRLTPLRNDPVMAEQVVQELREALTDMEVRVEFGDDESAFMVEVMQCKFA